MTWLFDTKPTLYERKKMKRDKSKNTMDFNQKVKKRRAKAKHDAKGRKTNRKK